MNRLSIYDTTPSVGENVIKAIIKGIKEISLVSSILNIIVVVVEQFVVVHGLLIRLIKLLTNVLTIDESVLVGLPRIVQVRIEVQELAPGQVDIVDVLVHLLAHIDKVLPRHRVVNHCHTARFFVALRREKGTLLAQIVHLLASVGEHVLEGTLGIVQRVHGRAQLIRGAAPLSDILAPEKSFFALVEVNALCVVAGKGLLTQPVGFLVALSLLAKIFEP